MSEDGGGELDMSERRRWCRWLAGAIFVLSVFSIVYLGYFCPGKLCALTPGSPTPPYTLTPYKLHRSLSQQQQSDEPEKPSEQNEVMFSYDTLSRNYNFELDGPDVLVFLHIQKTGGTTFGRHLVRNLDIIKPCKCYKQKKKCDCLSPRRNIWLFSRYSVGWRCGLHADWTELQNCVDEAMDHKEGKQRQRRYLYITILRDPVQRFLSEWKHVQRGATWMAAELRCNGRSATLEEVPFCFTGEDWSDVSLSEFIDCPHNLANNRQTRMLANLSLINCYNTSGPLSPHQRNHIMLQSAKENLAKMAFFGLTELQKDTQYMFERTFQLNFIDDFEQRNATHANKQDISNDLKEKIEEVNKLDIDLYKYAKALFYQRLSHMHQEDLKRTRSGKSDSDILEFGDSQSTLTLGKEPGIGSTEDFENRFPNFVSHRSEKNEVLRDNANEHKQYEADRSEDESQIFSHRLRRHVAQLYEEEEDMDNAPRGARRIRRSR